jgi:hypothetical protein
VGQGQCCGLALPSSGPPPAWPTPLRRFILRSVGQAGSGPLMSNVRQTQSAGILSRPSTSNQALVKVSCTNAAPSAASTRHRWRVTRHEQVTVAAGANCGALVPEGSASSGIFATRAVLGSGSRACAFVPGLYARRQAAQGWSASAQTRALRFQASRAGCSVPSFTKSLPNPSLERTSTGLALGPRGFSGYRPPRGPSANPASAAQLKR